MIGSEVQRAAVSVSAAGGNVLVAAIAGKKIRVVAAFLVASGGANNVKLESQSGGTALTGVMNLAANGQLPIPYNPEGWVETVAGEALSLNLSAATLVGGVVDYVTTP